MERTLRLFMLLTPCILPQSICFPANALGDTLYITCTSSYSVMYMITKRLYWKIYWKIEIFNYKTRSVPLWRSRTFQVMACIITCWRLVDDANTV